MTVATLSSQITGWVTLLFIIGLVAWLTNRILPRSWRRSPSARGRRGASYYQQHPNRDRSFRGYRRAIADKPGYGFRVFAFCGFAVSTWMSEGPVWAISAIGLVLLVLFPISFYRWQRR